MSTAEFPYADPFCCLQDTSSINAPSCVIQRERQEIMGKGDFLRDKSVSCAGRSIREIMEDELDEVFDILMADDGSDPIKVENAKGKAQGIAWCIALILQPYTPNVNGVKGSAVVRYRNRQEAIEEAKAEAEAPPETEEARANFAYFD